MAKIDNPLNEIAKGLVRLTKERGDHTPEEAFRVVGRALSEYADEITGADIWHAIHAADAELADEILDQMVMSFDW